MLYKYLRLFTVLALLLLNVRIYTGKDIDCEVLTQQELEFFWLAYISGMCSFKDDIANVPKIETKFGDLPKASQQKFITCPFCVSGHGHKASFLQLFSPTSDNIRLAKMFIAAGFNPNKSLGNSEQGLLHRVCNSSSESPISDEEKKSFIAFCLEKKADVNKQDISGFTPLHLAIKSKNKVVSDFLILKCKADFTLQDTMGTTAEELYERYWKFPPTEK